MKKAFSVLIIASVLISCAGDKLGYNSEKYGDKEKFGWDIWMLLDAYTSTYNKTPQNANDLMTFIDRMDKDSRLICEGIYRFDYQYLYLKDNQDKLIFVTDSLVSIFTRKLSLRICLSRHLFPVHAILSQYLVLISLMTMICMFHVILCLLKLFKDYTENIGAILMQLRAIPTKFFLRKQNSNTPQIV